MQWYSKEDVIDLEGPITFDDLKMDTPYRVTMPANTVSTDGMAIVNDYVREHYNLSLPPDFSPDWVVTKKEDDNGRVGTMPKRISKFIHKVLDVRMSSEHMAEIGNLARAHTSKETEFVFDLTTDVEWQDGAFADEGSCYWGEYNAARKAIGREGYALRVFRPRDERVRLRKVDALKDYYWSCTNRYTNSDTHFVNMWTKPAGCTCYGCRTAMREYEYRLEKYGQYIYWRPVIEYRTLPALEGIGRCWLVPGEEGDELVAFNAYGPHKILGLSRLLATILGKSYRKTRVENKWGGMWLNNGGKNAVVIGDDVATLKSVMINLEIRSEDMLEDEDMAICEHCGYEVFPGDVYWTPNQEYLYCENCYHDQTTYCEMCNNSYWNDDVIWPEDDGEPLCREHYNEHYSHCEHCHTETYIEDLVEVETQNYNMFVCFECEKELVEHENDIEIIGEDVVPEDVGKLQDLLQKLQRTVGYAN